MDNHTNFICLALGFLCARRIPISIEKIALKIFLYFSYMLSFEIAFEFAQVIDRIERPQTILSNAMTIAFLTILCSFLCYFFLFKSIGVNASHGKISTDFFELAHKH